MGGRDQVEGEERAAALEAACREAGPDGPDDAWRARWAAAIAALSPEEVRAWCRLRWQLQDRPEPGSDPRGEPGEQAALWGVAAVAAHGTATLLAEHAVRMHHAGRHRLTAAAVQALADIALAPVGSEGEAAGREAIGELARLRARLAHRGLARRIGHALEAAAAVRGLDAEAMQDLVVADGGLGADGSRTWRAGAHDVYLFLTDDGEVELAIFERASGRALGGHTQALEPAHFAAFQEARAVQRALADALATQKDRLEAALVAQRAWTTTAWRQVFGANPLMRQLAGRLVWTVWREGRPTASFMPAPGAAWDEPPADAELRLLHPALADPAEVAAWRERIVARRLVQPFKQLFREVVAPPEGDVGPRFEGQVVRQRSLVAILRARGWAGLTGPLRGCWIGRRELTGHGLVAVLTFRPVGKASDPQRRLVALEAVGFVDAGEGPLGRPRAPAQVPAVAYSEAMRDLALACAAAAPPGEAHARGPLALVARARAELVRALLPQLGLAQAVRIEGGAALVDCSGHVFRLDLGSGEVTLEPSGRQVDLDGLERADLPLYLPHEGADAPGAAVLATMVWLAKFGRACAERDNRGR